MAPSSPDCNSLDLFFWNEGQERFYAGRLNNPFKDENDLKKRIKAVRKDVGSDLDVIRKSMKQFAPRATQELSTIMMRVASKCFILNFLYYFLLEMRLILVLHHSLFCNSIVV